jgi:hypothetical protein
MIEMVLTNEREPMNELQKRAIEHPDLCPWCGEDDLIRPLAKDEDLGAISYDTPGGPWWTCECGYWWTRKTLEIR